MSALRRSRPLATVSALVLALSLLFGVVGAHAAEPPVIDNPAGALTADPLPTAQIDGVAWDQVVVGRTVFVGGQFSSARPAGSAPGQNTTPRTNLMSYDLITGELTSWAPQVNGRIRVVTSSPDGSRVYIGGSFTQVNGQRRSRIAAFNTADGSLATDFAPLAGSDVFGIAATDAVVYLGGWFGSVSGVPRTRLAAVAASDGAVLGWAPTADHTVYALGVTAGRDRVVVGGSFTQLNGQASPSMGSLDAVTGASHPFAIASALRNIGNTAAMYSVNVEGERAYATGFSYGSGNFEGALVADAHTGVALNLLDCHGDTYDSVPWRGLVYTVSHHHHCDNVGAFPEEIPLRSYRTSAFTEEPRGTVAKNNQVRTGLGDWEGYPVGSMVTWFPDLTPGTYTGSAQAAWSVEKGGDYLALAGEFTAVNGVRQQGLVRFAPRSVVGQPRSGPLPSAVELAPTLVPSTSTSIVGSFTSAWDRDGAALTYRVVRDDIGEAQPIATLQGASTPWTRPTLAFTDTAVVPGWSYTYRVLATDADGNTLRGQPATITAQASDVGRGYAREVLADGPTHYWRLGQAVGATAAPDQVSTSAMALASGVTGGRAGAITGSADTASSFARSTTGRAGSRQREAAPAEFSVAAWFTTSSTSGAMLVGFGDTPSGQSVTHDRHLYLDNAGRVVFGVDAAGVRTVRSPSGHADGQWHQAVGTVSSAGLRLYVDGVLVAEDPAVRADAVMDGHWRLGGDTLGAAWPGPVSTVDGGVTLDEVAIHPVALSPARVAAQHAAGRTAPGADQLPVPAFTSVTSGLTVTLDASGSLDAEGPLVVRAWEFGDGARATGTLAGHTYAAAGTYPVTLTVVDGGGQAARLVRSVTVARPPGSVLALDSFSRAGSGWGAAEVGGPWSVSGGAPSTDGAAGVLATTAGATATATLPSVGAVEADLRTDIAFSAPAGATHRVLLRAGGSSSYALVSRPTSDGDLTLSLVRTDAGGDRVLASRVLPAFGLAPGEVLRVRARVSGTAPTHLVGKVWRGGDEPPDWMVIATEATTPLPGGTLGLAVTSGAGPLESRVDNVEVLPVPANTAPRAAFTVTADGLAVAADASGSRDPDGTLARWSWQWGDGSTTEGTPASHQYAAAGTYTVRLTITDDRGATATAVRTVTVTAPVVVLAQDSFDRTVATGWGAAPVGGPWTLTGAAAFSVADGIGQVRVPVAGATRTATLADLTARDVSVTTALSLDRVVAGDSYYHQMIARVRGQDLYSMSVRVHPNGNLYLILARKVAGVETVLRSGILGTVNLSAGEQFRIRFDVVGQGTTTLRGTVWRFGEPEPAPQVVATDTTAAMQVAGAVGMKFYTGGDMTTVPLSIAVDEVRVAQP